MIPSTNSPFVVVVLMVAYLLAFGLVELVARSREAGRMKRLSKGGLHRAP